VSKTALRICLWEIRQALGDQAATPQYIETVGQRGYRFVAQMAVPGADSSASPSPFVGRQAELAALQVCLAQAQQGQPRLVFVTGDPGVGKTTLVQQCNSFSRTCRRVGTSGWGRDSASSTPGRGRRICPYSKPWAAAGTPQKGSSSWGLCGARR
jgi:hypothetical protein